VSNSSSSNFLLFFVFFFFGEKGEKVVTTPDRCNEPSSNNDIYMMTMHRPTQSLTTHIGRQDARRCSSRHTGRGAVVFASSSRRRAIFCATASSSSPLADDGDDDDVEKKKKKKKKKSETTTTTTTASRRRAGVGTPRTTTESSAPQRSSSASSSSSASPAPPFVKLDTRVFIVGAGVGTGSIQNLTIRAANILKSADVVIYDDLGVDSDETLSLCGTRCKKIYVGKRGGRAEKNTSQAEINSLLVELSVSGKYKHVVRLKGGDPTIFGRLGNEIEALKRAKVKYEIVPGVSSLVASAAVMGVSLTETMRGGKHFACISGHDAKTNPGAFRDLADVDTVVVFMGGKNIASVVDALLMNTTFSEQAVMKGRSSKMTTKRTKNTPCAMVRDADGVKEKRWLGTLGDIVEKTRGEKLSPCVLIVGEIVKSATLHERNIYL
jgi:uroporphyrin-III C-methyltransferase